MELATEPDTYSPNMDEKGNYIDKVPSFHTNSLVNGLRCPCGTRKDKIYTSHAMFTAHIKTKTHEKWLQDLNTNKANFYIENQKLRDIVYSQKIMIGKFEIELSNKNIHLNQWMLDNKYALPYDGGHKNIPASWLIYQSTGSMV